MNFIFHTYFRSIFGYLIVLLLCISLSGNAQTNSAQSNTNELTIYVMPTLIPLDWSSPASLHASMKNCYLKTITQQDNYLLGHIAVKLKSNLLPKPLLIAQTSGSLQEKLDLIFKQKIGFGIMGAALKGRIESEDELNHKLSVYAKRKKLAYITYQINEKAARRMIDFINQYSQKMNDKNAPCDFYGGAFWPLYKNEGASCSSFGVALLEITNLLTSDAKDWKLNKNIPMEIIGGEFNNNKKIKDRTIRKTQKWHSGNGKRNVDFVEYFVYEPSIMFDWIMKKRAQSDNVYTAHDENGIPGLLVNGTDITPDEREPFFENRPEPNLFIDYYKKKITASLADDQN